jgi:hypothetical protein
MDVCVELAIATSHVTARDVTAAMLPNIKEELHGAGLHSLTGRNGLQFEHSI